MSRAVPKLADADLQAARFERIRDDHRTEIAEDYVELIADLIEATGEARGVDLAGRLGVANATVNNAVARLQRDGLVRSEPYRSIFLTEKGWELARYCRRRHRIVLDFLHAIGVCPTTAAIDAEGIEHHVSPETLEALERVISLDLAGRGLLDERTGPTR
ncbi:manganese-binding transcriptional regulator MntR [Geminicoccaceae bacterium 1502E]|uniref:Transcriptional regulator MntR n=1 Tax=Marinimicrococcus flavescens TaxID=3031815 RepID=A0AAP3XQH9_9PROT|nr:manganese-binding transcriptional regulator MntR [Marinimicrococcus flavescens]MDX6748904.1 manganese-binding transcriptional regulator MntR [Geminicoccaceae bacterium 1502E]